MNPTTITYAREIVTAALVFFGACALVYEAGVWLEDRFTRCGWRIMRRWDRPGTEVVLPDGRTGVLETIYRGEAPGDMAVVIFDGAGPEWAEVAELSPVPAEASAVTA